jgi:hypothetical protein
MRLADVETVLAALATRPFLLLCGLSGTGKTQLVRRLAEAVSEQGVAWTRQALQDCLATGQGGAIPGGHLFSILPGQAEHVAVADLLDIQTRHERSLADRRVAFQPVRPDWDDAKKIWGYYNPLTGRFHPTDVLVVLLNAYRAYLLDPERAALHFVVLDEMNLARVEYYLSDVLSLMEAGCRVDPADPELVHLGELARVHPLESCVTSLGSRGLAAPPALRPPEPGGEGAYAASGGWSNGQAAGGRPGAAAPLPPRATTEDQLVPLWELEDDQWLYEPLVRALKVVRRPPPTAADELFGSSAPARRSTVRQVFPIPPRVAFPPNLIVVGTVNVDETTHGFAPKVLDRAFVVELTRVDHEAAFGDHPLWPVLSPLLTRLHGILEPWELQVGYRVVGEMLDYLELSPGRPRRQVEDDLLRAKILTRLSGSEERLAAPLRELLQLCLDGPDPATRPGDRPLPPLAGLCQVRLVEDLLPPGQEAACYPEAARKLLSMIRRLGETGFTSFF